jgi:L-amino acid N-acyltransferase YncA
MEDVPAADAGLGSGITNVAQQLSGAFGLAVLSTFAANHTQTLVSTGHAETASLINLFRKAGFVSIGTILGRSL